MLFMYYLCIIYVLFMYYLCIIYEHLKTIMYNYIFFSNRELSSK